MTTVQTRNSRSTALATTAATRATTRRRGDPWARIILPATATVVAPGLNAVAWASLISVLPRPRPQPHMNMFGDIFGGDDMLKAQENFCERPLLPELVQKVAASFVLQEKLFSMSGEVCHSL